MGVIKVGTRRFEETFSFRSLRNNTTLLRREHETQLQIKMVRFTRDIP